jgi:flagellar basal-body rod protein FlgC
VLNAVTASVSGLLAAEKKLEATSRNVANADTDGYKRRFVSLAEGPAGGVEATVGVGTEAGAVASELRDGGLVTVEKSNVDLVQETGDLVLAKPLYQANLKTLETRDEMLGTLLDVVR